MGPIASQITSLAIVYSTVYSDADQRKHQSSASLAFVRGIHRGPVNSPHKWPVTRKCFHFMTSSWPHFNGYKPCFEVSMLSMWHVCHRIYTVSNTRIIKIIGLKYTLICGLPRDIPGQRCIIIRIYVRTRRRAWHSFFHLPQPITQMSRQWFDEYVYIYSKKQTNLYFEEKYLYPWSFVPILIISIFELYPNTNSSLV